MQTMIFVEFYGISNIVISCLVIIWLYSRMWSYIVQVFFFKAQLQDGSVMPSSGVSDHAWLSHDELSKYTPAAYYRSIKQFLLGLWLDKCHLYSMQMCFTYGMLIT